MAKTLKNAQFHSEKRPRKTATKRGCFCCIFGLFFLNFFVFSPLFLLISCCFMLSWNPKTAHHVRLQAYINIVPEVTQTHRHLQGIEAIQIQTHTQRDRETTKKTKHKEVVATTQKGNQKTQSWRVRELSHAILSLPNKE